MNIKFTYLYRDAAHYKQYHEVVLANPNEIQFLRFKNSAVLMQI